MSYLLNLALRCARDGAGCVGNGAGEGDGFREMGPDKRKNRRFITGHLAMTGRGVASGR